MVGSATERYLDAAHTTGFLVLAQPGSSVGPGAFDHRTATEVVRRFDQHPALAGWYLSDEPDLHRIPPSAIRSAHDHIRRAGAVKPTAVVLYQGREASAYAPTADWLIMDRYPVPWLPLADFSKHLRLGRFAAGPRRPMLAVIQAFDWSAYPDAPVRREEARPPTRSEIRAMAYLSLLEGVQGILFYAYDAAPWRLPDHLETWAAVRSVVAEIRARESLFTGRILWRDFDIRYPAGEPTRNEALDPAVQAARIRVLHASQEVVPGDYLVVVNTLNRPVRWAFRPATPSGHDALKGPGGLLVTADAAGWCELGLPPYEVQVLGPLPPTPGR